MGQGHRKTRRLSCQGVPKNCVNYCNQEYVAIIYNQMLKAKEKKRIFAIPNNNKLQIQSHTQLI